MNKFWKVAVYEYRRHVLRRRFLFGLLSVPLMILVIGVVIFFLIQSERDNRPLGYVDQSGLLVNPVSIPSASLTEKPLKMIPFESEEQAEEALSSGQIQAYYVLGVDFLQTSQARLVSLKQPNSSAQSQFRDFIRANLLAGQPEQVVERVTGGDHLEVRSLDGSRKMEQDDFINILAPFFLGLAFMIAIFSTSGYLMQAVVEEKENRTVEVLLTSVSPFQLMGGKIMGIIAVGLTQLLFWGLMAAVGVWIGRRYIEWLQALQFSLGMLALLMLVFIPAFVMISALMASVGATVTEAREGQQITGLFTLPVVLPYWFTYQIMSNPNGPLALGLSIFPLTAPITLPMRVAFAVIPTWQIALSVGFLTLSALFTLWLAGRAFRLGMLQYGKRLSLRQIIFKATTDGMQ
jgi:ABC-2 type transport system permease protein